MKPQVSVIDQGRVSYIKATRIVEIDVQEINCNANRGNHEESYDLIERLQVATKEGVGIFCPLMAMCSRYGRERNTQTTKNIKNRIVKT